MLAAQIDCLALSYFLSAARPNKTRNKPPMMSPAGRKIRVTPAVTDTAPAICSEVPMTALDKELWDKLFGLYSTNCCPIKGDDGSDSGIYLAR